MPRNNKKNRSRATIRRLLRLAGLLVLLGIVLVGGYLLYLDVRVLNRMEGRAWDLPTRIYARPLELYVGLPLNAEGLTRELDAAAYQRLDRASRPGSYERNGNRFVIHTRTFRFSDGIEPARRLDVRVRDAVLNLSDVRGQQVALARLDPAQIGSIYPTSNEDREVVKLGEVPPLLIAGLLAVEDQRFTEHHGLDFRGLARAMLANLRAGEVTQGGSTITQQLAKNLFLSQEQTLVRKANEALMALLIEFHADKDQILEMYLNEVYLAQDGNRAIHGFGLGAWHFFGRPLDQLDTAEIATLIGIIKGPSYYNPRRHPERARERRNTVLAQMVRYGVLDEPGAQAAMEQPLGVVDVNTGLGDRYADFLDRVRRELATDYREDDLQRDGLRVFTTLDPHVQAAAQQSLDRHVADPLQGAVVVAEPNTGEIQALVGARSDAGRGFNRALDARRQVGSTFKPFVYLQALNQPERYTLATVIQDTEFSMETRDGQWTPRNHDGEYHGDVLMIDALSRSLNAATARLGQEVGMGDVFDLVENLGVEPEGRPYPSAALGAVEFTPLEVAQLYQAIASGGFPTPLTTLREVMDGDGNSLDRYGLELDQIDHPAATFLLTWALTEVTRSGTARGLVRRLGPEFTVAGKTGTSNDGRDAWFAGFTANLLAVAWVGRDDNQPTGLGGASGALPIFADLIDTLDAQPLDLIPPARVEMATIDRYSGLLADRGCREVIDLPFLADSAPRRPADCARGLRDRRGDRDPWWKRVFGDD